MSVLRWTILSCFIILFLNKELLSEGAVCNNVERLYYKSGRIESPGFSEGHKYPLEVKCQWIIIVPTGSYVSLTFKNFALEKSKTCEHYDNVTIEERYTGTPGNLEGKTVGYCGTSIPPMIKSTCNELHITFYSDDSDTFKGFEAEYKIHKNSDSQMITCFGDEDCNKELTQRATESFTFHCRIQGKPRPRRYWFRVDGKPLPDDVIDDNNGTLTFPSLRYPDDAGEYVCMAKNNKGQDFATAMLTVIPICPCPPNITTNWVYNPPFLIKEETNDNPTGIFPILINKMIGKCCGNCSKGHGISHIRYGTPKETLNEVKNAINSEQVAHLSFPLTGKETDREYKGNYYRPLFSSPGVAVLVMKEDPNEGANAMLNSVVSAWPVLLLTLAMAWLAGIVMWALDTWNNPDEFPRAFHRGVLEGFWWAFVTMTTVGYGDRSPKGYVSRAFAILWILIGLVIISITTGVITTSLTARTLSTDLKLYGAKVGALANSTELRMAVKKNSKVTVFNDLGPMFSALEDRSLNGILLDSLVAGAYRKHISSDVRVNKIIPYDSSYGIVFRDKMASPELQTCFNNYVSNKRSEISTIVEKNTTPVQDSKKSASEEVAASLFDIKTPLYQNTLFSCLGMLAFISVCGLIWSYGYKKHFKKNKNEFDDLAFLAGPGHGTVKANMKLLDTLMQEVQDFNDVWTEKLDEMTKKHDSEYHRFSQEQKRS